MKFRVLKSDGGNGSYSPSYEQALVPQNKAMNDAHLEELKQEWLLSHGRVPFAVSRNPALMAKWEAEQKAKAEEWARENEPKRFLNPLLRGMNGIKADKELRRDRTGRTATLSSSWVKDGTTDANGLTINIDLGGKKYTYGTTPQGLKEFYSSPSLGRVVSELSRANPGTTLHGLTKLWETKDRFRHRSSRGWNGSYRHGDFKTDRTGRR